MNGEPVAMSGTILVVEDDRSYRTLVVRYLRRLNLTVLETVDMESALKHLDRHQIDVAILDIGLGKQAAFLGEWKPGVQSGSSGYALLEMIRAQPRYISIIVLTSLEETIFEVACLQRGADDYLSKHIQMEALAARVQACLRRGQLIAAAGGHAAVISQRPQGAKGANAQPCKLVQAGDFHIDVEHRTVQICGGPSVGLSPRELRLLVLMAESPGRVFKKDEILESLWGPSATQGYYSVDALVKNTRRKIEPRTGKAQYLLSARGEGYRLNLTTPH